MHKSKKKATFEYAKTTKMPQGRRKAIETPERFLELFYQYREWKQKQVIYTHTVTKSGDLVKIPHNPPLTWASFDAWLFEHINIVDTEQYRANYENRYSEFVEVIRAINAIMYTNKFDGASCGLYNANIIARDLGLADKKDVKNSGEVSIKQITGMEVK